MPHNTRLLRLAIAYGGAAVSEWATWLAVLVYAHDRSGTTATGWTALGLLIPAAVFGPLGARLLGHGRPVRILCSALFVQAASLLGTAVLAQLRAPILAVASSAGVAIGATAVVRTAYVVIAPALVATARELTRSNLWAGWCNSSCLVIGPLVASGFLAWRGPKLVFHVAAVLALAGGCAAISLLRHDRLVTRPSEERRPHYEGLLASLKGRRHIPPLLAVILLQHIITGFLELMFIVLAVDVLHMGGSGSGLLVTAFGAGALVSSFGAATFTGRTPLAPVMVIAIAIAAGSMAFVGWQTTVIVAVAGLAIAGCSSSLVELSARILLQRSAPPQHLASVFGLMEALTSVGVAFGTGLAQWSVATVGAQRGLELLAGGLLVALVILARLVWRTDRDADVPVVAVALLRSMPIFAPLSPPALEDVARAAVERQVRADEVVIRQGEQGHRYFAIAAGQMEVAIDGRHRATLGPGQGAGEVSLLANVPRTATVRATRPTTVYEIDRDAFLLAVTGNDDAQLAAWWHIQSIGQVRPGLAD